MSSEMLGKFGAQHDRTVESLAKKHKWKQIVVDGVQYSCALLAPVPKTPEPVAAVVARGWPNRFDTKLGRYIY